MKNVLNKYFSIFKLTWKQATDYRFDFIFEFVCGFIPIIALLMLWNAIYEEKLVIGEYTQTMMVSYVVYARFINIVIVPDIFFGVMDEIQSGTMTTYLSKPINYIIYWFFKTLGGKVKNLIIGLIPIVLISIFYNQIFIRNLNIGDISIFLFVFIFAYILYFLIFMIMSLLAFWFYDISSWYYTVVLAIELLAGVIIPVSLFPNAMKTILNYLPFKYLVSFPVDTLIGYISIDEVFLGLFVQLLWIMILVFILKILWEKGVRQYEANGG